MQTIGITGKRSSITAEFLKLVPDVQPTFGTAKTLPLDLDAYFLCAGALAGKNAQEVSDEEAIEMFRVNFLDIARLCDKIFEQNPKARVCIIGSESGVKGSYDMVYAGTKAAIHLYVETKKLAYAEQHLVGIAPTIIEDSGMTKRRKDLTEALERGKKRRLGRWLKAEEVARVALNALREPSQCNTVVRLTGGNW